MAAVVAAILHGVFLVNNAPRVRIAGMDAVPALPDTSCHQIRVLRNVESGRMRSGMTFKRSRSLP
jgi:hypothetical protein